MNGARMDEFTSDLAVGLSPPASVEEFRLRLGEVLDGLPRRLRQCADYISANTDRIAVSPWPNWQRGRTCRPRP